jgi:crotonobetainyl-CoA:carnitine CoA-transferase CaiB-like acyl-CoA transferase
MEHKMNYPLEGIRIIDVTTTFVGPICTLTLADLGADVIKIERPQGDVTRGIGPARHAGMASIFLTGNRNKRSVVLDLGTPRGQAALMRLCETADVFIHNMRGSSAEKLKIDYSHVRQANEKIIYCATYGFGAGGVYDDLPAYEDIIQGATGMAAIQSQIAGRPAYLPAAISDKVTGLYAALSITAALHQRRVTGQGQAIEVPMFETMVYFNLFEHLGGRAFEPAMGAMLYPRMLSQNRRPLKTADGYICVMMITDHQWRRFFTLIGRPEIFEDQRFSSVRGRTENVDQLYEVLGEALLSKTTAEWLELLEGAAIPNMPLRTVDELFDDPHLKARESFKIVDHPSEGKVVEMPIPIRFSGETLPSRRHAPLLGEHSVEVLTEAGLSRAEIDEMLEAEITSEAQINSAEAR